MFTTIGRFLGICQAPVDPHRHPLSSGREIDSKASSVATKSVVVQDSKGRKIQEFKVVELSDGEMNELIQRALNNSSSETDSVSDDLTNFEETNPAEEMAHILLETKALVFSSMEKEDSLKILIEFFSSEAVASECRYEILPPSGAKIHLNQKGADLLVGFIKNSSYNIKCNFSDLFFKHFLVPENELVKLQLKALNV